MGLKKAWVYDSSIPATLTEELGADGYECPASPGLCATFEEKHAALERHSLSASGDLASGDAYEWPRISVAARTHELKTRRKKTHGKGRRSSSLASNYLDEDTQREFGLLSGYGVGLNVDKANGGGDSETSQTSRYSLDLSPHHFGSKHKATASEPVVIDTVDDLLRHLERLGRLKPALSSLTTPPVPTVSPAQSVSGSETEGDSGDSSFVSQSSTDSESTAFEAELVTGETLKGDAGATASAADVENLVSIISSPDSAVTLEKQLRVTSAARAASRVSFA